MTTVSNKDLLASECHDKRAALLTAIEECEDNNRLLKAAMEAAKLQSREYAVYMASRAKVATLHDEYEQLRARFTTVQGIAN